VAVLWTACRDALIDVGRFGEALCEVEPRGEEQQAYRVFGVRQTREPAKSMAA
jgi:hypothetical protein